MRIIHGKGLVDNSMKTYGFIRFTALAILILLIAGCKPSFQGFTSFAPDPNDTSILSDPLTIKLSVPGAVDYTSVPLYVYRVKVETVTDVLENEKAESRNSVPVYLTYYRIHFLYNYSTNEMMDEYGVSFYRGTSTHCPYGDVLPQIGEEFILAENNTAILKTFGLGLIYRIVEIDREEYAIPYCMVTENFFDHGVTPPEQYSSVYTKEHDRSIINYLRRNRIKNPIVKEIFKLDQLIPQLIALQAERNEEIIAGTFVYDPEAVRERPEYTSIIPYQYEQEDDGS